MNRAGAIARTTSALLFRACRIVAPVALALLAFLPGSAPARPLVTGISGVVSEPPLFSEARSSGATMVRIAVNWDQIAPKAKPASWNPEDPGDTHYDWAYLDRGVTEAVQAGLTPLLTVDGAPHWAQRCPSPPGLQASELCDPDPAALEAFAVAVGQRYSGHFQGLPQVRYWQGLNEPNLTLFFFPQFEGDHPVSPQLYRQLINAFYAGIKSVDPSNVVLAAGLGPIAVPKYTVGPMRFARLLLCMTGGKHPKPTKGDCEGGVHFDAFDIHPYTTGGPSHEGGPNDVELGSLGKLTTLLRAAERAGRIKGSQPTQLWVTEFSWDSKPPDPGGLPMKILSRWTAEALYRSWKAGVDYFFWYGIRDEPLGPTPSQSLQAGLYFSGPTVAEDKPKQILYAFRFPFVAYPGKSGLRFWGRTPDSGAGRVAIQVQHGARWGTVKTAEANSGGIFEGTVKTRYGIHKRGSVRAIYEGIRSVPFSMRPVPDFYQPPLGRPVANPE